ncbi:HNH endonuclease [Hyphomonas johnsonii]|uniref:HNH endonuclease n=1 Tax=Hyphomonas johnsonii TaxID=81031 RepID=UPI0009FD85FE|nr:HNH endonuclease [Hyphomonas johnsonii]
MVKVVLVEKSSSIYDDDTGIRYHFPRRYLNRVESAVRDWAVFYRPVKDTGVSEESRGSYFATAELGPISPDPSNDGLYYVEIRSETYADFASPVPRIVDGSFIEPSLAGKNGSTNVGVALQAVRHIPDEAFDRILGLAWPDAGVELPRVGRNDLDNEHRQNGVREDQLGFVHETERKIVAQLLNRKVRDARFRTAVLHAYEKRCAITGWNFINGGGRAEAEAAHIRPVEHGGPDKICNGLALSGTVHWMFDRGLIGVAANDEIIISRKVNDRESIERLINPTRKLVRPKKTEYHPHPEFLRWHREFHRLEAA